MSKEILSIKIVREVDNYPDTSYLGEYSEKRARFSFDRKVLGDMERNEYRYFNPYPNPFDGKTQSEKRDMAKLAKQNYERMEGLKNGSWEHLFIRAEAKISINGIIEIITSGGLGGVESDSGDDYLREIEQDELNDLKKILKELGFNENDISEIEVQDN